MELGDVKLSYYICIMNAFAVMFILTLCFSSLLSFKELFLDLTATNKPLSKIS